MTDFMNNEDENYALALQMQEEFDREQFSQKKAIPVSSNINQLEHRNKRKLVDISNQPMQVIDPSWELIDPTPDLRAMFLQFDSRFFEGKLHMVEVKWSPRMTSCAGVCSYEGRGGLCSIRLSVPLLKLRPRKDLVETLLHEMIHALLFVTNNDRDRDGHGPTFQKHMHRINADAGTNITIYHNFHDEVRLYQVHWWRCNGSCQFRPPYFGMLHRAMNRAPGPSDFWWARHMHECGGTYIKVKGPDLQKSAAAGKSVGTKDTKDILSYFGKKTNSPNSNSRTSATSLSKETDGSMAPRNQGNITGFKVPNHNNEPPSGKRKAKTGVHLKKTSSNDMRTTSSTSNIVGFKDVRNGVQSKAGPQTTRNPGGNGVIFKKPTGFGGMLANKGSGTLLEKPRKNTASTSRPPSTNFVPFLGQGNALGSGFAKETPKVLPGVDQARLSATFPCVPASVTDQTDRTCIPLHKKPWLIRLDKEKPQVNTSTSSQVGNQSSPLQGIKVPTVIDLISPDVKKPRWNDPCITSLDEELIMLSDNSLEETPGPSLDLETSSLKTPYIKNPGCLQEVEGSSSESTCPVCNIVTNKLELYDHLETCIGGIFDDDPIIVGNEGGDDSEYACPCCSKLIKESHMNQHLDECLCMIMLAEEDANQLPVLE